jgi:acylphosphatase
VKNCDDGSVEALAMGSPAQLAEFASLLHRGPRFSDVRSVEETEAAPVSTSSFSVR